MKIGTIMGVLAAAAAVAAIAIAAPSRAAERSAAATVERVEPTREVPAWVLVVSGLVGLGVMFRAASPAFRD